MYFDVETTGLDSKENEIVQLGVMIEIDGEIRDERNFFLKPEKWDKISPDSLEITGKTLEDLKKYPDRKLGYYGLTSFLGMYCDKFDREDKYYPAGYNVGFDLDFLGEFFKSMKDPYLGSWINWRQIDPLKILYFLDARGDFKLPNYKLSTVCELFKIDIDAHDAMSDIRATRELTHKLFDIINLK